MYRLMVLLLAVLVAASPAEARQMTPEDQKRAASFAQSIQKVYDRAMAMSVEMDTAQDYIDSYIAGDLTRPASTDELDQQDPEGQRELEDQGNPAGFAIEIGPAEFIEALDPFLEGTRAGIDEYRARYPRAPSSPSIGSPPHERTLTSFAKAVVGLGGLLDRQLGLLYRLRDAALAGDEDAYMAATAGTMALAADMKLAENQSHEASLVAMEPEHPRRGLVKAIIGGNRVMAVALRVMEAGFRGREYDTARYSLEVETGLRDAGRGIVEGERAAWEMLKDLEGKFAETNADRYHARYTGEMVKAYDRAFAIEREILETQRGLLDFFRAVNSGDEDTDSAVEAVLDFQAELEERIRFRVEEQNIRRDMDDEYARAMDAL